jgi:hypothetical protein
MVRKGTRLGFAAPTETEYAACQMSLSSADSLCRACRPNYRSDASFAHIQVAPVAPCAAEPCNTAEELEERPGNTLQIDSQAARDSDRTRVL